MDNFGQYLKVNAVNVMCYAKRVMVLIEINVLNVINNNICINNHVQ